MTTNLDDLAGAQAKFVLFIASLFARAGVVPVDEFGRLLALFAETVAETDPDQARLLSVWADGVGLMGRQ